MIEIVPLPAKIPNPIIPDEEFPLPIEWGGFLIHDSGEASSSFG